MAGCGLKADHSASLSNSQNNVFQSALEDADFVGDVACFDCHEDEYQGYQEHGMSNSMFRLSPEKAVEDFGSEIVLDSLTGLHYRSVAADSGYFIEEYLLDEDGSKVHSLLRSMDWVVGSGTSARTYLSEKDGWFYELPITWYTQQRRWDFSPGYRVANKRFDRKIVDRCMACHNSYPTPVPQTNGQYLDMPEGIGCERCHGPGSVHVEQRLAFPATEGRIDSTIVNPAHLSLDAKLDVCQQCHLNTSVSLLRTSRTPYDFRPSQKLDDYIALYAAHESVEEGIGVISHADRMKISACFIETQSLDKPLECTTCHNPHEGFRSKGPDYFNSTCIDCHESKGLQAGFADGVNQEIHGEEANCVACHMPKTDIIEAPHSAFTDHWIQVPGSGSPKVIATHTDATLEPVFSRDKGNGPEAKLYEGMALVTEGQRTANSVLLKKAIEMLGLALKQETNSSEAFYLHGYAQTLLGRHAEAIPSLETAVRMDPTRVERLNTLAQAFEKSGRDPGTIEKLYREALRIQPAASDVRLNLGRYLESEGRLDEAIAEYKTAIREEAWNETAFFNLGTAYLRKGNFKESEINLNRALELDPFYGEAMSNLGLMHIQQGEMELAESMLLRAVSRVPAHTGSLDNLGSLYLNQDRYAEATQMLKRAVDSSPSNDALTAKLALAYFRNDDFDSAKRFALMALELNAGNALAAQIASALE